MGGLPVNIHIPEFIAKVAEGDFAAAYEIISQTNALPRGCPAVCAPQETQCEALCVRGIKGEPVAIGRLERFVADWYREHVNAMPKKPESNGHKVAGGGLRPCGPDLRQRPGQDGLPGELFEGLPRGGRRAGVRHSRVPSAKAIVANEVEKLKALGVDVETNTVVGKTTSIDELFVGRL